VKRSILLCKTALLASAMLVSIPSVVHAGAESGFYIGGSVGSANQDVDSDEVSIDDDASGGKIFAGYNIGLIPFLDLAVETSYVDFGEISSPVTGGAASVNTTGLSAFGLLGFKLGPLGFFAKTGLINWESETRVVGVKTDNSGSDAAYGIGTRFQLGSIAVRAEYEVFDIDKADIDFFTVGASWTF
jgi:outer membrane immunogenic protein